MILKIKNPTAANAYLQYPQTGTGTQGDPYDWYTVDTVVGANSTVTIVEEGDMAAVEIYFNAKLTASQLYTFSISGVDEMSTTVTIYYEGSQVAQSTWEMAWQLTYTPSATGTYLIKVATYAFGMAGTMTTTPVPTEITAWIEKTNNGFVSTGFDGERVRRYSNALNAGLTALSKDLVFGLRATSGLVDLSPDPVNLISEGTIGVVGSAFVFDGAKRIFSAPSPKLNLGVGDWTVEIVMSGQKVSTYPCILGSCNGFTGGFAFVYKHSTYTAASLSWQEVWDPTVYGTTELTDDTVYTLKFVKTSTNVKIYLNGVLDATDTLSPGDLTGKKLDFNNAGGYMQIGRNNWDGAASQFYGKIYSVFIWSRAIA
jgi:hypothetical protein